MVKLPSSSQRPKHCNGIRQEIPTSFAYITKGIFTDRQRIIPVATADQCDQPWRRFSESELTRQRLAGFGVFELSAVNTKRNFVRRVNSFTSIAVGHRASLFGLTATVVLYLVKTNLSVDLTGSQRISQDPYLIGPHHRTSPVRPGEVRWGRVYTTTCRFLNSRNPLYRNILYGIFVDGWQQSLSFPDM